MRKRASWSLLTSCQRESAAFWFELCGGMPPKKRLRPAVRQRLEECLQAEGATAPAALRRIWNQAAAAHGGEELSQWELRNVEADRLERARGLVLRTELAPLDPRDGPIPILVTRPAELFRYAVERSPVWAAAMEAAMLAAGQGPLQMVLYHDDVQTGNILAPRKDKKCTLIYISLKEMCPHLGCEEAWLPAALALRPHVAAAAGGMSALLRAVCRVLHSAESLQGFPLQLPSGSRWCTLSSNSLFLADMDAQRATWRFKGSAGLKPCLHCFNVLSKGSGLAGHPFVEIEVASLDACVPYKDVEMFQFADDLATIRRAGARAEKEKVYGFNHCPEGMLMDLDCRQHLPPSSALTDAFHCYFANGCASWELGLLAECLRREGAPLAALRTRIEEADWRRPHQGHRPWTGARHMLHVKMWDSDPFSLSWRTSISARGPAARTSFGALACSPAFAGSCARSEWRRSAPSRRTWLPWRPYRVSTKELSWLRGGCRP